MFFQGKRIGNGNVASFGAGSRETRTRFAGTVFENSTLNELSLVRVRQHTIYEIRLTFAGKHYSFLYFFLSWKEKCNLFGFLLQNQSINPRVQHLQQTTERVSVVTYFLSLESID